MSNTILVLIFQKCSLWHYSRYGKSFVFTCYLDDSDNKLGPSMGIAGYVAHTNEWIEFERNVGAFLDERHINTLRGKDFHNGHNDFKNWSGADKRDFVEQLYSISSRYIISGINSIVNKRDFERLKRKNIEFKNLSSLGVAFASAVQALTQKDIIPQLSKNGNIISFIVESGNKNNQNLVRYFEWLKTKWPDQRVNLGEISFVDKHDCRAIQLADFLAFHGRRQGDDWARSDYIDQSATGDAIKIMKRYILHRHCRFYGPHDPEALSWFGQVADDKSGMFLPVRGLR